MTTIKRRVSAAAGAHALGQALNVVYQLIGVPIFLWAWGAERYGEWLLLTTVPSVLSMSNTSFSSAAASEMAMRAGDGDHASSSAYFQSAFTIVVLLSVVLISLCVVPFAIPDEWLHMFRTISPTELRSVALVLALQVIAVQLLMLFDAAFRSTGQTARGILWINAYHFFAFIGCVIALSLGGTIVAVATSMALGQWGVVLAGRVDLKRSSPWLTLRLASAHRTKILHLSTAGFAYTAFPLAQALRNQGVLVILGVLTSATTVVMFNAMRTLSNVVFQAIRTIQRAVLPELSVAYGSGDLRLVRRLHRKISQASLGISLGFSLLLAITGRWIFIHWTAGKVPFERGVFYWLLLAGALASVWNAHLAVALSINAHRRLSMIVTLATAAGLAACYGLVRHWGPIGASWSLLVVDLTMCAFVVPHALAITDNDWKSFLTSHLPSVYRTTGPITSSAEQAKP